MQDPPDPRLVPVSGDDGAVDRDIVQELLNRDPCALTLPEVEAMHVIVFAFESLATSTRESLATVSYTDSWMRRFVAIVGGTVTREKVRHGKVVHRSVRHHRGRADVRRFRAERQSRFTPSRDFHRRSRPREHRPCATRRASSSSRTSSSDPGPSEPSDEPEPPTVEHVCGCCTPPRPVRLCACGCGRDITHRRADAKTFGSSCRQRLARATAREQFNPGAAGACRCANGFFYRDAEGDSVCAMCGHWVTRVVTPINGFDALDALLRSNDTHVVRRPLSREWRVARKKASS
jgi:hypothetical protein